jgi:hypothetical protein
VNEAYFTRQINQRVSAADPAVVVWKISDRFNAGRPDCHYLKNDVLYVEYKFARTATLPTRHTPTLSPIQTQELKGLYAVRPKSVRVIVGFALKASRDLVFVEFSSPDEWENSTPLAGLPTYTGYTPVVQRILSFVQ